MGDGPCWDSVNNTYVVKGWMDGWFILRTPNFLPFFQNLFTLKFHLWFSSPAILQYYGSFNTKILFGCPFSGFDFGQFHPAPYFGPPRLVLGPYSCVYQSVRLCVWCSSESDNRIDLWLGVRQGTVNAEGWRWPIFRENLDHSGRWSPQRFGRQYLYY